MTEREIKAKIEWNQPDDWRFICNTLDNETIDSAAEEWAEKSKEPVDLSWLDEPTELGLLYDDEQKEYYTKELTKEPWVNCLEQLMRKATMKMWATMEDNQVMDLINALERVNAEGVVMANGAKYATHTLWDIHEKAKDGHDLIGETLRERKRGA